MRALHAELASVRYERPHDADAAGAAVIKWGVFINAVISFLIVAWVVFILVKMVNRVKDAATPAEEPAPEAPAGPSEVDLLMEIRDALKAR